MTTKHQLALGVDLGGTTFGVGLLTAEGKLLADTSHPTPTSGEAADILGTLARTALSLAQTQAPGAQIVGLGIGIPGPVDPVAGHIQQCPNLHALDGANAAAILSAAAGIPAYLGNDAFCATLAELRYGAGRDCRNLALLTLGTGVGGGIAIDNKVLRGPRQIMGEVGHIIIEPDGPRCGCGNHGCLEALTGRQAIVDLAARKMESGRASRLEGAAANCGGEISPRMIADLAREGDGLCQEVMDQVGYYLGLAICNIIVLCDPDRIVLGGGIAGAGEVLFGSLRRTVAHRSCISGFDPAHIVPAELGNLAGIYGAGALVWEHQAAES
jgi:glucokinase